VATKKRPGKLWFKFKLFGLPWEARVIPAKHKALDNGDTFAFVMYDERWMGFSDILTLEQQRTSFAHELQHVIEEHADVNYEEAVCAEIADRCTDQVARGWLYVIRECPEILAFLQAAD
jgi:hypothetical protein